MMDMSSDELTQKISEMMLENHNVPDELRNQLVLALLMERSSAERGLRDELRAIRDDLSQTHRLMDEQLKVTRAEIAELRSRSIILWVDKNKRLAAALALLVFFALNFLLDRDLAHQALAWMLGVPVAVLP